ncbi:MAG: diaminopimelate decarboxylase [Acidobacteria bacterium]|nr:MAG: diaminopimelate decarboxylase [Acidobacteriota bacterium]
MRRTDGAELFCDEVSIREIAERYGTPLYVYSGSTIRDRLKTFDRAFRKFPHTICYSVKANSNLSLVRLLNGLGCGFDVVSGGELQRVLAVDRRAAKRVVFSGVGKTSAEMDLALRAGISLFNVESESELWKLAECAARARKVAPVALRVNPDVSAETHPYISTGLHQHKFGIPIDAARELYASASGTRHLQVSGVSVHIGSQITSVEPFAEAMSRVAELVRTLRADGHRISYADAGGGLGVSYDDLELPEFSSYVNSYANALTRSLRGLKLHLLLEPGRAIVAPAGALVTTVLYRKQNDGKKFLITDAAMNDLLRPSLYSAYHQIIPVRRKQGSSTEKVDVVGPICETGDFFARDRQIPEVAEGDLLAIVDAGAYGMALASNYNSRPRAAEVLVDGRRARLVRRRETITDLLKLEL